MMLRAAGNPIAAIDEAAWDVLLPGSGGDRLQAFVDQLYGGNKPENVVDDLIAERRR